MTSDAAPQTGTGAYVMAVCLAALAGCVDAAAYLQWGGLYVSFMSGNSTALGTAVGLWSKPQAALTFLTIASFVVGVVCGELIVNAAAAWARSIILLVVSVSLWTIAWRTLGRTPKLEAAASLAFVMGVQNAAVHRAVGVSPALTYVTGTLVRIGRALTSKATIAGALKEAALYAGLWVGFVSGAAASAALFASNPSTPLTAAAAIAFVLATAAAAECLRARAGAGSGV